MRKSTLGVVLAAAFAAMGTYVYNVSYIDNSRYWGIPLQTTRDSAGLIAAAEAQEDMEAKIASLPDSIARRHREVLALQEQQKYLYNKLYNATVDLEKNSNLDLNLIARIGPNANLFLRDVTKTGEALQEIGTYEVNLPPDSPVRNTMSDLRLALAQEAKSKEEYLEKLNKWRGEEAEKQALWYEQRWKEAQAKQEREFQRLMNPEAFPPEPPKPAPKPKRSRVRPPPEVAEGEQPAEQPAYDPYYEEYQQYEQPEPEPTPEPDPLYPELEEARTSTDISGKDGEMLGLAHKIMADIQITQAKMADVSRAIVREHELLDQAANPGRAAPLSYMFVRDRSDLILEVDQPLYQCKVGIYWCRQVGTVKGVTGPKAEAGSPTSGKKQPGFLIPIELTDPAAQSAKILHIYEPPTRTI